MSCGCPDTVHKPGCMAGLDKIGPTDDDISKSVSPDDNTGRPVRVHWIDSGLAVSLGWKDIDELPGMVERVETVGLWMGENERVVMVGSSRDAHNNSWMGAQLIYKPCILETEWL